MKSSRLLVAGLAAFSLAASVLVSTGCKPKAQSRPAPAPFTGQLTELDGVQAVYTVRHPRLILADFDKLIAAIPEAAMARMFMGGLSAYGYPEFTELAADTNFGVALLSLDDASLSAGDFTFVGFAKLKPDGKIATALKQSGLVLEQRGEWTWVARDAAAFAKVRSPDALLAHIARPQTEEVRVWGRANAACLTALKTRLDAALSTRLAERPADERAATQGYVNVLWSYVEQLHSAGFSLDLGDQGLALRYSAQFQPDTDLGVWLRHDHGPAPAIAASLPADGQAQGVVRYNTYATRELFNAFFDRLLAVDYAPGRALVEKGRASLTPLFDQADGGTAMTMSLSGFDLRSGPPGFAFTSLSSGDFKAGQVKDYCRATAELSEETTTVLANLFSALSPGLSVSRTKATAKADALTLDGVSFDSVTQTLDGGTAGGAQTVTTQYYGVVHGTLVSSTSEDGLRTLVPALLAKKPADHPVQSAMNAGEFMVLTIQGENIVDLALADLQLDRADADVQAGIDRLKAGYRAGPAPRIAYTGVQAEAAASLEIPYGFIAQTIRLIGFVKAHSQPAATAALPVTQK